MELTTLKVFNTAIEAHILKNKLEDIGILCYIFDENIVTLNPLLNFAVGGVRLQVNKVNLEKAKDILIEIDNQPYTNEEDVIIRCPNCNSASLYSDFKSMKDPKNFVAIVVAFFVSAFPIYSKSVYKCKECDTEFEKD